MKFLSRYLVSLLFISSFSIANAATIEVDTITGGVVDSVVGVTLGDFFSVDVVVESVFDLAAHDIVLDFNDSILSAISLTSGLFYGPEDTDCLFLVIPGTCNLVSDIGPGGTLNHVDLATDLDGNDGSGILFTILFEAIGVGTSDLSLGLITLSDSLGGAIIPATFDGSVIVSESSVVVPLPGALVLFMFGLAGLVGVGNRKKSS